MSFYNNSQERPPSCLPDLTTITGDDLTDDIVRAISILERLQQNLNAIPRDIRQAHPSYQKATGLLYAMMDFAPLPEAREKVARQIVESGSLDNAEDLDYGSLIKLSDDYTDHLIRSFKTAQVRTPSLSRKPHIDSVNAEREAIAANLSSGSRTAVKTKALERDGYRCLISGVMDQKFPMSTGKQPRTVTNAAHIIPHYLAHLNSPRNVAPASPSPEKTAMKTEHSAAFWEIAGWFGGINYEDFNGPKINSLENILTIDVRAHGWFDNLTIWFEETSPNNYRLDSSLDYGPSSLSALPNIRFTTHDAINYPLPRPALLRLHAACAKIARMSGMGELIDQWEREIEEMGVLASDGSSMPLLTSRLTMLSEPGLASRSSLVSGVA